MKRLTLALALIGALVVGANAQLAVGAPFPSAVLEGFAQTGAKSWSDLAGRAVVIEFFAYW